VTSALPVVELEDLGFDAGAHVLVRLGLAEREPGEAIAVRGRHPELAHHLTVWCRQQGHRVRDVDDGGMTVIVERGAASGAEWRGAVRGGEATPSGVVERPAPDWGLAARGAAIEPGGPRPRFDLVARDEIWTERAAGLYAQAAASQWDPAAIDWTMPTDLDARVEAAVVQVMTFLIENEVAALVVPARFLGQVHPHFREIQQFLAITVADEARHIDVFTRRATLTGQPLALSSVGGRASLQTLLDEPDFAIASFLLSVMGEGTFLSLLGFLERCAPDPLTRRLAQLTRNDEARHVAFSMAHLERHLELEPALRSRLAAAVEARHHALQQTAGLNEDVFDALVVLAAGAPAPDRIAAGWRAVQSLQHEMDDARAGRLTRLGFTTGEAETLASLHTRNFM
jgi:TusA-related sulfurtransferase